MTQQIMSDSSLPLSAIAQRENPGMVIGGPATTIFFFFADTGVATSAPRATAINRPPRNPFKLPTKAPANPVIAVGAMHSSGVDKGKSTGHVGVYQYKGSLWQKLGPNIIGEAAGDQSGFSVSLSDEGNRVAVGAPGSNGRGLTRVFEFSRLDSKWVQN